MKKKLVLLFCMLSCVLMVAGCSLVKENNSFDKKALETQTDEFINTWFTADFNGTIETYKDQMDEATLAQYKEYAKLQKEYQGVEKKIKTAFTITADSATVNETVQCTNGKKIIISLSFDETGNIQTDESGTYQFKFNEYKSLGQLMERAGLNTIMSMAIVFAVLIFISLLISCFVVFGKFQNKQKETPAPVVVNTPAQPTVTSQENLADDLELVAVITAAIVAANKAESADGLVVRSIIRRS